MLFRSPKPLVIRLFDIGGEASGESVEEFTQQVRTEIARWKEVAKTAGIKPL